MKLGDKFEVFECLKAENLRGYMRVGFQSVGAKSPEMPNVEHTTMQGLDYGTFTMWPGEYKKIGTLTITKLK